MTKRPHVSAALAHLKHGVTLSAIVVGVCAVTQLVVFGFVHFTHARWLEEPARADVRPYSVVVAPAATTRQPQPSFNIRRDAEPAPAVRTLAPAPEDVAVPTVDRLTGPDARQLGPGDEVLRRASNLAVSIGVIAMVVLSVLTILGVVVAGGACVPGVEKAVTACTWSLILALLCLPLHDVFESVPFGGVFGGYEGMTAASEAVDAGIGSPLAMYGAHLLLPLGVLIGCIIVALRFHAGVEAGVIITSISELDEALEREMAGIRRRGVGSNIGPRAVGVLNQAMGERPVRPDPAADAVPNGKHAVGLRERRVGGPDPGDGLKRPI